MAKTRRRQLLFHEKMDAVIQEMADKEFKSFTGMVEHILTEYIKNNPLKDD